jgi:hypothetical protein
MCLCLIETRYGRDICVRVSNVRPATPNIDGRRAARRESSSEISSTMLDVSNSKRETGHYIGCWSMIYPPLRVLCATQHNNRGPLPPAGDPRYISRDHDSSSFLLYNIQRKRRNFIYFSWLYIDDRFFSGCTYAW